MKHTADHPSSIIDPVLVSRLREFSAAAESLGALHTGQLAIVYDQGWLKFFVPKVYGGLELSLPDALRLEEALAWTDGSLGWTVTLCSGANWFVGFLAPGAADALYKDPRVCLAGSGRASGVAEVVNGGYRVTGEWHYATGALHATAFTANCRIEKGGIPLQDTAGNPLIRSFWFYPSEVQLIQNWKSIGMIATGSHGYAVKDLMVPADRSFLLEPGQAILPQAVYHFPFQAFAEATLAVNYSGMAIRFLDLCADIFAGKEQRAAMPGRASEPPLLGMLAQSLALLQETRQQFYTAVGQAWQDMVRDGSVTAALLAEASRLSRQLALLSRQEVDALYPFCGLVAADPTTVINRVWRDLHTASQHSLLVFPSA